MRLKETIRKILIEETQDFDIEIKNEKGGFDVHIIVDDKIVGVISFEEESSGEYTIVDANIDEDYRGKGLYRKSIIKIFDKKPNITINSVFRSDEAERAWKSLINKLPDNIEYKTKYYKEEKTRLHQLRKKK